MFLKQYSPELLKKDIPAGIIIALVSIPISIGYSLVAGLPPVFGLYGSLLPILVYGLTTTSPRFVFGVDAAPAALVGGVIYGMGITMQSEEAMGLIPVMSLLTAAWLLIFRVFGLGKFVKFISSPVLGGFITGICCNIILMQLPKLFGGNAGMGELFELLKHLYEEAAHGVHWLSLALGVGTVAIIMVCRKLIPRIPMTVVMMFVGAGLTVFLHVDRLGVKLLPAVPAGLPHFILPKVQMIMLAPSKLILSSLTVALVILAETLLATNSYAMKYGDKINNNREILAYALGNLAAAVTGCCPVNGSVSRTGIADQFGVRSQVMSITAAITMALILIFGTGFIQYLPVPVLTGIVISALMGILEFDLAHKLRRVDPTEWKIFYLVMFTVLIFGTIYGVLIGIVLSFVTVIIRASDPPRSRMGYSPEKDQFYPVGRNSGAREIRGVLIYRISGSLFFANAGLLQEELEREIKDDTKTIIIDASGISSIDITAVERLLILYENMQAKGIHLYLTEHTGHLNDQLRTFGAEHMFYDGAVRPKIALALEHEGMKKPYELEEEDWFGKKGFDLSVRADATTTQIAEFEWAYGEEADSKMQEFAEQLADRFTHMDKLTDDMIVKAEHDAFGDNWSAMDEEKFLDFLEMQFAHLAEKGVIDKHRLELVEEKILKHHAKLDKELSEKSEALMNKILDKRAEREAFFREKYPDAYKAFADERKKHREILKSHYPELMDQIHEFRKKGE